MIINSGGHPTTWLKFDSTSSEIAYHPQGAKWQIGDELSVNVSSPSLKIKKVRVLTSDEIHEIAAEKKLRELGYSLICKSIIKFDPVTGEVAHLPGYEYLYPIGKEMPVTDANGKTSIQRVKKTRIISKEEHDQNIAVFNREISTTYTEEEKAKIAKENEEANESKRLRKEKSEQLIADGKRALEKIAAEKQRRALEKQKATTGPQKGAGAN